MRVRSIVSAAAIVTVSAALVRLFLVVGAEQAVGVPEDRLAEARQRYQRTQEIKTARGPQRRALLAEARREAGDEGEPEIEIDPDAVPWEARARPAQAVDLHDGVTDTRLAARLDEAQTLYRRREYRAAIQRAEALLARETPDNLELRRIVVRAACIEKDASKARKFLRQLPEGDHEQLLAHCSMYGVPLE